MLRSDQVEYAVTHDHIDGGVCNERPVHAIGIHERLERLEARLIGDRILLEPAVDIVSVELQVLDLPFAEFHVAETDRLGDHRAGIVGDIEHLVVDVDTDDPPFGAHDLARNEADLARAGAQIEHRLTGKHILRGVAAAVISLDDHFGDHLQVLRIIINWAAQGRLSRFGCCRVPLANCRINILAHRVSTVSVRAGP